MRKLFSANFTRLFKYKLFWTEIILAAIFGVFLNIDQYRQKVASPLLSYSLDKWLFVYSVVNGILAAVFCSMFLGTEYSNGTIRNKLIVGHSRYKIYLANLTVCSAVNLLICTAYLVFYCISGKLLIGKIDTSVSQVVTYVIISIILAITYTSIYTMLTMLLSSKAAASVVCIITFILLLFLAAYVKARLDESVFYEGYEFSINGVTEQGEQIPNPQYLEGNIRTLFEFFYDFLPTGQGAQLVTLNIPITHIWRLPMYSLLITVMTTFCGIFFFKRKNLK